MTKVGIRKETAIGETRVAAVPATVNEMSGWDWDVLIEAGAGDGSGIPNAHYAEAGATVVETAAVEQADVVVGVAPLSPDEIARLRPDAILCGFLEPFVNREVVMACCRRGLTALAMEAVPRTTLAQSMDALSSQTNVAGYAAVLLAAQSAPKMMPMMVTAAGTIAPARVLILGVGVAGLQAIATARRLGALVHAYDIRPETAEQVESLGAKFVSAPTAEADEGGYARQVEDDMERLQHQALGPHVAESDIVVTTAQIPGRPAPRLITEEMINEMKPGAIIVDMATASGGNCDMSKPDQVVEIGGIKILGPTNLAAAAPGDASRMYARNVAAILERSRDTDLLTDEILGEIAVVANGEARHPRTRSLLGLDDT